MLVNEMLICASSREFHFPHLRTFLAQRWAPWQAYGVWAAGRLTCLDLGQDPSNVFIRSFVLVK